MVTYCRSVLLAVVVLAGVASLKAQENIPIIHLTNSDWRYLQGECPDGSWPQRGYNDGAWPSGLGVLGFENNPAIAPLIHTTLQPPSVLNGMAAYFRTRFNW